MAAVYDGSAKPADRPLSPRQERVAQRLLTQVGPGPAAFFRDACRLVSEGSAWPSVTHQVAHLLREVDSAVQSVLEPQGPGDRGAAEGHKSKIKAILTGLVIPHDDLVAEYWLGFAGQGNPDNLATRAHRNGLDEPRPFGTEFVRYVDRFEQVLDVVLERFETSYFEIFERLEKLLATPQPGDVHAQRLRQRFPSTEAVTQYFFSRASADWVSPLHRTGFFAMPPSPQAADEAGMVQFPAWPASQFLARVAAAAPEEVVAAALAIPATDNIRVKHDLVEIAVAVPAPVSARLVPSVIAALGSRYSVLIPQRAGALAGHLCDGGQAGAARDLSAALFKALSAGYGRAATMHAYAYGVILRDHLPVLVSTVGMPVLGMLCQALDEIVSVDMPISSDPVEDVSPLWRPDIASRGVRSDSDLRHSLVEAIRDASARLIESGLGSVADVVVVLESHHRVIFRRIALHFLSGLSGHPEASDLIAERLIDAAIIRDWRLDREYLILARSGAACLSQARLRCLLTLIDSGPVAVSELAETPAAGEPPSADPQARDRAARWQRNRLAAIQVVLPPEWDARYQALETEFGPAPDLANPLPAPFAIWGDESPVTAGELAAMPTDALVAFLKAGQVPGRSRTLISPESMRGALSSAIQADAEQRSADAASFIGLPAEYVGAVINGLWQALANGAVLNWDSVIPLSAWISRQADEELADSARVGSRHWREPRTDMIRLLIAGLSLDPSPIPACDYSRIWVIVSECCHDPDPTPRREMEAMAEPDSRFMSLALTAVRAQAVHAVISYGLWLRRQASSANLSKVQAVLDRHLDCRAEPSRAVRSVYGMLFAQLAQMDEEWAARHVQAIFPQDPDEEPLLRTAWDTYLTAGYRTEAAWALMASTYSVMTDRMDLSSPDRGENFSATQLGKHLLGRLWAGRLDLDSHDGVLRRFYDRVSPEIAVHLMWWVSSGFRELNAPDPELIARLAGFWEYRVTAVKNGADAAELADFGRWFSSGYFDPAWSLRQLMTVMSRSHRVEAEDAVLSKLADMTADHTQDCLAFLERWVSSAPDPWRLAQCLDSIRRIVATGVVGNPTASETSKKIVSILLRNHVIDIRDVLQGPEPS